jgi:hypothetical protein
MWKKVESMEICGVKKEEKNNNNKKPEARK